LLLDEAYGEFAPPGTLPPLDTNNPQVLRFRTFSKAYGMAGMRVGYAIGHAETIKAFDKVRNHFGVTRLGQQAAIAALGDPRHLSWVLSETAKAKDKIAEIARVNGLLPLPSATNFVTIDCGSNTRAKVLLDRLLARRIFIRMPGVAPLNRCIRISAGTPVELEMLAGAMAEIVPSLS
jgi:histidinol-phosphate aminotransferase